MPIKLSPDSLAVESFAISDDAAISRPRTYEPGYTLPEICGDGAIARPRTYEPGCTLPELCGGG